MEYQEIRELAKAQQDYVVSMRREFHRHPEVSGKEYHTRERLIPSAGLLLFLFERSGRMGKVLIWFVIIISTVVLYCLMIMKDKAESDELYEELMRKLILKGGDLQVLWFNTEDMKKVEKMAKKYGILYGQMMRVIRSTQCRRKILKFLNRRQTPKEVPCA